MVLQSLLIRATKTVLPVIGFRRIAPIVVQKVEKDVSVVADALFPNDHFHLSDFSVDQRLKAQETVKRSIERAKLANQHPQQL